MKTTVTKCATEVSMIMLLGEAKGARSVQGKRANSKCH